MTTTSSSAASIVRPAPSRRRPWAVLVLAAVAVPLLWYPSGCFYTESPEAALDITVLDVAWAMVRTVGGAAGIAIGVVVLLIVLLAALAFMWPILLMAATPFLAIRIPRERRRERALRGDCVSCGYTLLATQRSCPECGAARAERAATERAATRPRRENWVARRRRRRRVRRAPAYAAHAALAMVIPTMIALPFVSILRLHHFRQDAITFFARVEAAQAAGGQDQYVRMEIATHSFMEVLIWQWSEDGGVDSFSYDDF